MIRRILAFIALMACLPFTALSQTRINPERDLQATATDSVLLNLGGSTPAIIRALICADRTGATCPVGSLFVDNQLRLTAKPSPPAAGLRRKCQDAVITTGNVSQVLLNIVETTYVLESMEVYANGLWLTRTTAPNFVPDYTVNAQTVTINRAIAAGTPIGLCYNY